tara:strand:- start:281 stop:877 length:597 start_codon:yes stop_codon:yes gene_type:complete
MPRKNKTIKRKKTGGFPSMPSMPGKKQREQYNRRQDRKARLAELEKLIGRLDDTNYNKLKRSLIRLSGRDPESSEYDEFQPWPTEDAYKDGSSLLLFDEEANWKDPTVGARTKRILSQRRDDGSFAVPPCVKEFNTSTGELEDKIGCEDWRELIGYKKDLTMNPGQIELTDMSSKANKGGKRRRTKKHRLRRRRHTRK